MTEQEVGRQMGSKEQIGGFHYQPCHYPALPQKYW